MKVLNIGLDSNSAMPHKWPGEMDFLIKFHFTLKTIWISSQLHWNYNLLGISLKSHYFSLEFFFLLNPTPSKLQMLFFTEVYRYTITWHEYIYMADNQLSNWTETQVMVIVIVFFRFLLYSKSVFFNLGSAEPRGSAKVILGSA